MFFRWRAVAVLSVLSAVMVSLPASASGAPGRTAGHGRRHVAVTTFEYETDFAGIYTSTNYSVSSDVANRSWYDTDWIWGEVTYFRCETGGGCTSQARLSAGGSTDASEPYTSPNPQQCAITSNPAKTEDEQNIEGPPPPASWQVPANFVDGFGLKVEPDYGQDQPCGHNQVDQFLPIGPGLQVITLPCTSLAPDKHFKDAWSGTEVPADLPVHIHGDSSQRKSDSCGAGSEATSQAQVLTLDDDVWMGRIGKVHGKFQSVCKLGCLFEAEGLAVLTGTLAVPAPRNQTVTSPQSPPGSFTATVTGQVVGPGSKVQPTAGRGASYKLLATAKARWTKWTPFDTITIKRTPEVAKLLRGLHGPIKIKVVEHYRPKGSKKTRTYTLTITLPAIKTK